MVKILLHIIFFSASNYLFKENVLPTNQVPFIGDYTRIVCAISNKFFHKIMLKIEDKKIYPGL
jgi:hypothetical protein